MSRLAQLKQNTGWRGVLQTGGMWVAFAAIAVTMAVVESRFEPIAGLALGALVPTLLRRVLVAHPGPASTGLRWSSWGLFGAVLVVSALRDRIDDGNMDLVAWGTAGMTVAVTGYVTSFFWLWSDPDVHLVE